MSCDFKNSLKVASIIIGTVIGAGFASGQEILQFFTVFGGNGALGILLAGVLFCLVSAAVLDYVYKNRLRNYTQLIVSFAGKHAGRLIEITVMVFLLSCFFIMIAGTGALFKQYSGIGQTVGAAIMAAACLVVFLFNFRGMVAINTIVAPILIVGIGLLGLYICSALSVETYNPQQAKLLGNWVSSAVIYVSYNSISLITVLATMLPYLSSRKVVFTGAVAGSGTLCMMALLIYYLTSTFYPDIMGFQIPLLEVVEKLRLPVGGLYSIVLFAAMFTSAVTAGFCFLNKISYGVHRRFNLFALIISVAAVPMAGMGFSNLVSGVYPVFGYIGLFQVILILSAYLIGFKPLQRG